MPSEPSSKDSVLYRYMHPLALWSAVLLLAGALRDVHALVDAFDTGLYLQWLYGFWHTGSLASSLTGEANFLAHHFQPAALILAPWVSVFSRPLALFIVSSVAVFVAWYLGRSYFATNRRWYNATFLILAAQPAIAGRIWYGFVPDILAMPAFFWMALQLASLKSKTSEEGEKVICTASYWLFAFIWAGCSKETFWLTNVFVALVGFYLGARRLRFFFAVCALVQVAIFCFLFLSWMPQHSNMQSYYGLSFYLRAPVTSESVVTLQGLLAACAENFFSLRTLTTLATLILLTCAFPLLKPSWVWVAAVPGLFLILLARDGQVHHPANHYLIPVLPFLMVPAMFAQQRYHQLLARLRRGVSPLVVAAIPIGYVCFMTNGLIDHAQIFYLHPELTKQHENVQKAKLLIPERGTTMLVDGMLQPLFYEYRRVHSLLGHVGNPVRLNLSERPSDTVIVSSIDLKSLPDCRAISLGAAQFRADYEHFAQLCELVKKEGSYLATDPKGLTVLKIPATIQ